MLCFSPGKQLPPFISRLRFSQEERTVVKRESRGSLCLPCQTAPRRWAPGLRRAGTPWRDREPSHVHRRVGSRGQWQKGGQPQPWGA